MYTPKNIADGRLALVFLFLPRPWQVPDAKVSEDEVEALVTEADAYSLASHLFWAMWALLQSKVLSTTAVFSCESHTCTTPLPAQCHLLFSTLAQQQHCGF